MMIAVQLHECMQLNGSAYGQLVADAGAGKWVDEVTARGRFPFADSLA
ncbi:hypothetical protein [Bradyrhizobium sp. CCBAU 11434]|nr:hypothetical protein [Bradyrhizobium sp. CCBAU 11434]